VSTGQATAIGDAWPVRQAGHEARDLEPLFVDVPAVRAADEVPAAHVVDVAVVVVVGAVGRTLARVRPERRADAGVRGVHAAVDDRHHHPPLGRGVGEQLAQRAGGARARDVVGRRVAQLPVGRGAGARDDDRRRLHRHRLPGRLRRGNALGLRVGATGPRAGAHAARPAPNRARRTSWAGAERWIEFTTGT
jgi:hypothetical protein